MNPRASLAAAALALSAVTVVRADEPGKGPRETVSTTLGGKKVTVEYGRPPLLGQADLLVAGQKVPAGKYTLYAHVPEGEPWALLISSDQGTKLKDVFPEALDMPEELAEQRWPQLGMYEKIKAKEVARAPLKRGAAPKTPAERFQITLAPESGGASTITLTWGDQSWTADLKAAK